MRGDSCLDSFSYDGFAACYTDETEGWKTGELALKQGKHGFDYKIENKFFESFDYNEFNAASIDLQVGLNKLSTMMELEFSATGLINVNCDITNEPYDQPIDGKLELLVKFGEGYNDDNDEILIIPHGEHQINVAQ